MTSLFKCNGCWKTFKLQASLDQHVRAKHSDGSNTGSGSESRSKNNLIDQKTVKLGDSSKPLRQMSIAELKEYRNGLPTGQTVIRRLINERRCLACQQITCKKYNQDCPLRTVQMPKEELPNIKSSSGHIHKNSGAQGQKNVNEQVTAGPSKSNLKQNQKDAAEKETPVPPTSQPTRDQKKVTKKGKATAPQSQTSGHIKSSTADAVEFQSKPGQTHSAKQKNATTPNNQPKNEQVEATKQEIATASKNTKKDKMTYTDKKKNANAPKSQPKKHQAKDTKGKAAVSYESQSSRDQKTEVKQKVEASPKSHPTQFQKRVVEHNPVTILERQPKEDQQDPKSKKPHSQETQPLPRVQHQPNMVRLAPIDTRCECCNINFGGLLALKRHIMDSMQHWACLACPYGISTDFHSEKDLAEHFEIYHLPANIPFSKTKAKYYKTPTFCARCAIPTFPSVAAAHDHFYPPTQLSSPDREHFPCQRMASVGGCLFDGKTSNDLYRHWAESGHALLCNGCDGWFLSERELLAHWEAEGACRVCGAHWGEQVEQRVWCEDNHMQFEWEDGMGVWVLVKEEAEAKIEEGGESDDDLGVE
ncbi:hypothetical protein IWX49DRAFT_640711 [Phyllosticta citricarpa]|uniref:C2H2-type domain-containing protein n=2 Tax=Phyllosticta TaxID=121621 RepID=A0ABR1MRH5_9PEZI